MRAIYAIGLALASAACSAHAGDPPAASIPLAVSGGELDPAYPGADVYLGKPADPVVPPGKACAVAKEYVDLVNAGEYTGVAALYAEDAILLDPMRPTSRGRAQIDDFYTKRIGAMTPQVMAVAYLGDARECMVELALNTKIGGQMRWVLVSLDHFILREDGKIASMVAFARPPRSE